MKQFKRITAILLSFIMLIAFAACSANSGQTESTTTGEGVSSAAGSETSTAGESSTESTTDSGSKILVAYFSATGTTKGVAQTISDTLGADLYEITPQDPYTDADLDYSDSSSRSTVEMNDENARPAISGSVENMEQYDVVFIGYPIWWGDAPRIISTFMESYNFGGKTIVPFCTSGSSGIGTSAANLAKLTDNADWLDGQRFGSSASQSEITDWLNGLNLENN